MPKKPQPKPKPKPEPKYGFTVKDKIVHCFKSPDGGCTVVGLWEAKPSEFHDAELARATKEINKILGAVQRNNRDPDRTLSFIEFENRHFLVWSSCGTVGPSDDDKTIIKTLKLKAR